MTPNRVEIQDLPPGCRPALGSQKLWTIWRLGNPLTRRGFAYWEDRKADALAFAGRWAKHDPARKYLLLAVIAPVQNGCLLKPGKLP